MVARNNQSTRQTQKYFFPLVGCVKKHLRLNIVFPGGPSTEIVWMHIRVRNLSDISLGILRISYIIIPNSTFIFFYLKTINHKISMKYSKAQNKMITPF